MAESIITVRMMKDTLVVDSRLTAQRLGVDHADWFQNLVLKYQEEIEEDWGIIRFENGEIKGRGRPERYALLTENQATLLMTYTRNTEQARLCKRELVKAFAIAQSQPAQSQHPIPPGWHERMIQYEMQCKIPKGYFTIFAEV